MTSASPNPVTDPNPLTDIADLTRWGAAIGTALARIAAPDPEADGRLYRRGTVALALRIDAAGQIADIRIVHGSGDASLDRRAIAKLRRGEPLPAGPAGAAPRTQMAVVQVAEPVRAPIVTGTPRPRFANA